MNLPTRALLVLALMSLLSACSSTGGSGFAGRRAPVPVSAPDKVQTAVVAANQIVGKPYKWGGGHGKLEDSGYDCSGTVSYALAKAGLINAPTTSSGLMNFGESGRGKWITIYARQGHAFMVVAGMRLDTTGRRGNEGPAWRGSARDLRGFVARHPAGL